MQTLKINGYEIEVFTGYNGDQVFISKNGETVYSARTIKNQGLNRALEIVG